MAGNPAGCPSFVVDSGSTPARWLPAHLTLCSQMKGILTAAAVAVLLVGCKGKSPVAGVPMAKATSLVLPGHIDGAWVMTSEWMGYMGVSIALQGDRYYYWMYSDVGTNFEQYYPYTGTWTIEGDILVLGDPTVLDTGLAAKPLQQAELYSRRWRVLRRPLSVSLHSEGDNLDDHGRTLLPDFQFDPANPFRNQGTLKPEQAGADQAATAPAAESEADDKPQPEPKPASQ